MPRPNPDVQPPRVDAADVTFAGEPGVQLCREIGRVSAGLTPVEQSRLTRRPDGAFQLAVTPQTISVMLGRAQIVSQAVSV